MIKTIKIFTLLAAISLLSSFTGKTIHSFIGTYGVPDSDPSQIKLIINPDHTFYYQDLSVPAKKIIVEGNWSIQRKKVILESNRPGKSFHHIWTFAENGQIARSRKGLTFYRLGKLKN